MNILDQIVNDAATVAAPVPAGHNPSAPVAFRGLTQAIEGGSAAMPKVLDWKVVQMPVATVGKTENRIIDGYKAIHRSDNGAFLSIASDQYKPVQNSQMMEQFLQFAEAGHLKVTQAGCLDEGRKVFAVADTGKTRAIEYLNSIKGDGTYQGKLDARAAAGFKTGDIMSCKFVMSNGHAPGMSFKVRGRAERLACLNGLTVNGEFAAFAMTHRTRYDASQAAKIREMISHALQAFERMADDANAMAQTAANRLVQEAFVVELLQPELIKAAAERLLLPSRFATASAEELGKVVLDEIVSRDQRILDPADFSRRTNHVLNNLDDQTGSELSEGTLWHALNGVTHYVDHVQGRSADTGVQSSLFGQGDALKTEAKQLATRYVARLA